jgi:hypothetical protein
MVRTCSAARELVMSIETKRSATKPQTTVKQPTAKQSTSQGKAKTTAMLRQSAVLQRNQVDRPRVDP